MLSSLLFSVVNLGCRVNRVESDTISAQLLAQNAKQTSLARANLIIINTCAVTAEAEKKTRKTVRQALSRNKDAAVLVTGCSAFLHPEVYTQLDSRIEIVEKPRLFSAAAAVSASAQQINEDELIQASMHFRYGEGFRTRAGVKVQDGCDNECSYCIIHVARGKARSVPALQVLEESKALIESGARELVLAGINLGSYRDNSLKGDGKLSSLLHYLLEMVEQYEQTYSETIRLRLSSIEPMDVDSKLINLIARADGKICRYLHLPLQSGSSKVLSEMARPYTAQQYLNLVSELRKSIPGISLTTDCIVGFPGETEDEFTETLELSKLSAFSKIHVFPYSQREGTPAAARKDQIEPTLKNERAKLLRALSDELARKDLQSRSKTTELALVESSSQLMTESFHSMRLSEDETASLLKANGLSSASGLPVAKLIKYTFK